MTSKVYQNIRVDYINGKVISWNLYFEMGIVKMSQQKL